MIDLTPIETESALWLKLKGHLIERLQDCRLMNDRRMPEEDRHMLLGRIEEIKAMLAWEHDDQPLPGAH